MPSFSHELPSSKEKNYNFEASPNLLQQRRQRVNPKIEDNNIPETVEMLPTKFSSSSYQLLQQQPLLCRRRHYTFSRKCRAVICGGSALLFILAFCGFSFAPRAIAAESRRASSTAAFDLLKRNKMAQGDSQYQIVERGSLYSLDYRIFFKGPTGYISPWHDIPLYADEQKKLYNMVVEIPRWTNAKMEMATKEPLTPIKQDEKKSLPRFVHNIFPHHGYIWNYGALPQTWEDPNHEDENTKAKGDNDPIDVIEIGSQIQKRGAVVQVKIIGTLALLDEGETDWKLVAISAADPLFDKVSSLADVEEHFPGLLKATEEWFRIYKIPTGKPANEIAFNGEFKDADFANKIIAETHEFWKLLMKEASPKLNTEAHVDGAVFAANDEEWTKAVESSPPLSEPKETPADNDKWHFIRLP